MRTIRLLLAGAGAALSSVLLVGAIHGHHLDPTQASVHYAVVLVGIVVALAVWERHPESRTGPLLVGALLAYGLSEANVIFPRSSLAQTASEATAWFAVALFAHLMLSYPTGRFSSRLDRGLVIAFYSLATVAALLGLLFDDPRFYRVEGVTVECLSCGAPLFTNVTWYDLGEIGRVVDGVAAGLIVLAVVLLVRKIVRAAPGARRVVAPLVLAALLLGVYATILEGLGATGSSTNFWTSSTMFWAETVAVLGIPLALGIGVLWSRSARSRVADLVVDLEHSPPGSVRDALARTLGDPSLELGLWLPERGAFVDGEGRVLELPRASSDRAVTILGTADAPIAALVHDPALLGQRALLDGAGAAARFALENERLQTELRLKLDEVRASRARIVQAGDDERRRLERNLHDGAQQRLLSLGLALQLARAELGPGANGAGELLDDAENELRLALAELRELARGIHPAILADQGLGAAVRSLADRSAVPVTILDVPDERLAEPVEAAAYFLVSESLANVAKYAHAEHVSVSVARSNGGIVVDVEDDGVGGADSAEGSGLRGLLDRVQALDGRLTVDSPPGHGTRVHAEIPCAS
jgi:signal transduction histidine kinase